MNPPMAQAGTTLRPRGPLVSPPVVAPSLRVTMSPSGHDRYRVRDVGGRLLGHLFVEQHPLGTRYGARRYQPALSSFRSLGDFWSADDAILALRGA